MAMDAEKAQQRVKGSVCSRPREMPERRGLSGKMRAEGAGRDDAAAGSGIGAASATIEISRVRNREGGEGKGGAEERPVRKQLSLTGGRNCCTSRVSTCIG